MTQRDDMRTTGQAAGTKSREFTSIYEPYMKAEWGLLNHWYPIFFENELKEGDVKGATICGHDIAVVKPKGADRLYAVSDRCAHRGVKLSAKPMCLSPDTVTCWYHGFTYSLDDGKIETIIASPDDPVIGKPGIRTYPLEVAAGIVFVFVGDPDYGDPPPLARDLPIRITDANRMPGMSEPIAHPLDKNVYARGIHRTGQANWRLAVENGFDPGHLLIHADNPLPLAQNRALPLGFKPVSPEAIKIIDDGEAAPGIMNMYGTEHYVPFFDNPRVNYKARGENVMPLRTSMYVPGCLLVEHWPIPTTAQYEWYVPIDDKRHEYWEVIFAPCNSEEEFEELEFMYENMFEPLGLRSFNNNDLFAREALQDFYENHDGWNNEVLCDLDGVIVGWRKIASRYNRGIAPNPLKKKADDADSDY